MKGLAKLALLLAGFFLVTFAIAVALGLFDESAVTEWMRQTHDSPQGKALISAAVIGLLGVDLLLPVPGGPVMILAGNLLGPVLGTIVSTIGGILTGAIGYYLCRWGGQGVFNHFVQPDEADRVRASLTRYGPLVIFIARAMPILPEVIACLAGMSRMKAVPFFTAFSIATLGFAAAHAVAGAYSSIENPWPGIIIAILVPAIGWAVWQLARRRAGR